MKHPQWSFGKLLCDGMVVTVAVAALVIAVNEDKPGAAAAAQNSESLTPVVMTENTAELTRELAELKQQLARLAGDQQGFSRKFAALSAEISQTVAVVQEQDFADTTAMPPETLADSEPPVVETVIAGYQQTLEQEPLDPDWTFATETSALAVLDEYQFTDIELNYTECHQRACRLEFEHPAGAGDATFVDMLQMSEAFAGDFYVTTETDGDINRTVMFVARAGETLPRPEHY
jgi:hypothetical protein